MKYKHKALNKNILRSLEFRTETVKANIKRGTMLATIVIAVETALAVADVSTSLLKVDERFAFNNYLLMYLLMIAMNIFFLAWTKSKSKQAEKSLSQIERIECVFILYVTFMLCWGSVLTLMDQKLYGGLSAFMINALICLIIYNMETRFIAVPFTVSGAIVAIGMPFCQSSTDILIGNYVNLAIFLLLGWIASRIAFDSHYRQLTNTISLNRTKDELVEETKINIKNNAMLLEINQYLKKLSMLDDLTHLPNRRSFRYFIDYHFENKKDEIEYFSIIMIDVDNFKQLNDQHGHSAGDKLLKRIANHINAGADTQLDFIARWGGDEFIFASFNRNENELQNLAGSIRERILTLNSEEDFPFKSSAVSVSMGLCLMKISGIETVGKCIENADKAMYAAKAAGRNRIQFGPECIPVSPSDQYNS